MLDTNEFEKEIQKRIKTNYNVKEFMDIRHKEYLIGRGIENVYYGICALMDIYYMRNGYKKDADNKSE